MAPEYAMRGYLTNKADVYSFGVVALEIVSGKSNTNYRPKEDFVYLLDWVCIRLFSFDFNDPLSASITNDHYLPTRLTFSKRGAVCSS